MKIQLQIILIALIVVTCRTLAQEKRYDVELTSFSSLVQDEFSPVFYKSGVVFSSSLRHNSLLTYQNKQKNLYSIFYVSSKDSTKWGIPHLFSKELTTYFNDGPITFNQQGNIIYFGRNNNIKKSLADVSDNNNTLGIYSAEIINGKWMNITPFPYNSDSYSLLTPSLSNDGQRLYFASDMPGGYGGTDLYYSYLTDEGWSEMVNLGSSINTPENESFPFICKSGRLFFASEGHNGMGGKDIYFSQQVNGIWLKPFHLDADINTEKDDFGLVTDETFQSGLFSSNRQGSDDIYRFSLKPIQFCSCDSIINNNYCFLFYDEYETGINTRPVVYEWSFGDNLKKRGLKVKHCFPGPGKYSVKLEVHDAIVEDSIIGKNYYEFELFEREQAFINSLDVGIVGDEISFDGISSCLPNYRIIDYWWDFGEGFTINGPIVKKTFSSKGEYIVNLGLVVTNDSISGVSKVCGYKKIKIYENIQQMALHTAKSINDLSEYYSIDEHTLDTIITSVTNEPYDSEKTLLDVNIFFTLNLSDNQKANLVNNLTAVNGGKIIISPTGIENGIILDRIIQILQTNTDLKLLYSINIESSLSNQNFADKSIRYLEDYFSMKGISINLLNNTDYDKKGTSLKRKGFADKSQEIKFIFYR